MSQHRGERVRIGFAVRPRAEYCPMTGPEMTSKNAGKDFLPQSGGTRFSGFVGLTKICQVIRMHAVGYGFLGSHPSPRLTPTRETDVLKPYIGHWPALQYLLATLLPKITSLFDISCQVPSVALDLHTAGVRNCTHQKPERAPSQLPYCHFADRGSCVGALGVGVREAPAVLSGAVVQPTSAQLHLTSGTVLSVHQLERIPVAYRQPP